MYQYIVYGVIVAGANSVAVIGNNETARPESERYYYQDEDDEIAYPVDLSIPSKAVRVGEKWREYVLTSVQYRTITLSTGNSQLVLNVGESFWEAEVVTTESKEISRTDNIVTMTSAYHDYLLSPTMLLRSLWQASANLEYDMVGSPIGYSLSMIEPGSVFEELGLRDWDIVMAINGYALTDPVNAIKTLTSLKSENELDIEILRDGLPLVIKVHVRE